MVIKKHSSSSGSDRSPQVKGAEKVSQRVSAKPGDRIISASHLVSDKCPELSELEFSMNLIANAYSRWMVRCMEATGIKDLAATDVVVLHHVYHRKTPKRVGDICFVLNFEDTHIVSYALKKLIALKLVKSEKNGKEVFFSTTDLGQEICERYKQVREACLLPGFTGDGDENQKIGEVARVLRTLSGRYDQAARAASSF
jgi:predicted MarR family transcription regulator